MKKKKFDFDPHYSLWYVWWTGLVVVITTLTFFKMAIGTEENFIRWGWGQQQHVAGEALDTDWRAP